MTTKRPQMKIRSASFSEHKTAGHQRLMLNVGSEPYQMVAPGGSTTCMGCTCCSCSC